MGKQSLAATSGAVSPDLKLPAVFQAPCEPIKARYIAPYAVFAHPRRSDEWKRIAADCGGEPREGDIYLVTPDRVHHMPQLKCCWLCHRQVWAQMNDLGNLQSVSFREMPKPYNEHVHAVLLVLLADRIVPANIEFRSTKCPAAKTMSDALSDAADPSWAAKSPSHRETLVCQQAFMRFYGVISVGDPRTSKTSGRLYRPSSAAVHPTTVTEWRLFKEFIENPESQKLLNDAADRFELKVRELSAKAK